MSEITLLSREEIEKIIPLLNTEKYNGYLQNAREYVFCYEKDPYMASRYKTDFARLFAKEKENPLLQYDGILSTTRDVNKDGEVCIKFIGIGRETITSHNRNVAAREYLIPLKDIPDLCVRPIMTNVSSNPLITKENIKDNIITYGEYPQDEFVSKVDKSEKLIDTGKIYTIGNKTYPEYYVHGQKVIKYTQERKRSFFDKFKKDKVKYIKVEEIMWYYFKELDIAIPLNYLFSGVKFTDNNKYTGNFNNTDMKLFLEEFSKEILPLEYYLLEKMSDTHEIFEDTKEDKKLKQKCYEIIKKGFPKKIESFTIHQLIYDVMAICPGLSDNDYKKIMSIMMRINSSLMKDPHNEIEKEQKQKEYEKQFIKDAERQEKEKLATEIVNYLGDSSVDEIAEYIYKKKPNYTDKELKEVLSLVSEQINIKEEEKNTNIC